MNFNTYISYTGDGNKTDFAIPFSYRKQSEVSVTSSSGAVDFTFVNPQLIRTTLPVANGDTLWVQRQTDITEMDTVLTGGGSITPAQLNDGYAQLLDAIQELNDKNGVLSGARFTADSIEGQINGAQNVFTITQNGGHAITLGETLGAFWLVSDNGLVYEQGVDYTIASSSYGTVITFTDAPQVGDKPNIQFIQLIGGGGGVGGTNTTPTTNPSTGGPAIVDNGTNGHIPIVTTVPTSCSIDGELLFDASTGHLLVCSGGSYVGIQSYFTPNAPSGLEIVNVLPTTNLFEGRVVVYSGQLYVYHNGAWVSMAPSINASDVISGLYSNGVRAVEYLSTLPTTGNVEGRLVFNTTDNKLYIYHSGGWMLMSNYLTPDAPSGITVYATLPTTGIAEGTVAFQTSDSKLYQYTHGAWVAVVSASGAAATVAAASLTTAAFASGITPVEIASTLPTTGNFAGRMVFNTSDSKLYRWTGSAWTASVDASNITGQLSAGQLAANSVTAGTIAAGAISTDQIAANAITSGKIYAGAITGDKIAANAIDATKITAGTITGDKLAANTITAGQIQAGTIGATQIAAGSITADKFAAGALTAGTISAGSITSDKLAAGAVTAATIASGAITSDKLASNSVTAASIQAGAIGATQIAAGAISASKLASDAIYVGTAQIADASITTLKVAGNAITQAQSSITLPQQEVNSTSWTTVASMTVTVSGTQPILLWSTWGCCGAHVGSSSNYDIYSDGNYWKLNTNMTECIVQFVIGGYSSGEVGSFTCLPGSTQAMSAQGIISGVPAGTYTVALQLAKANGSTENFGHRTASLSMLETKR